MEEEEQGRLHQEEIGQARSDERKEREINNRGPKIRRKDKDAQRNNVGIFIRKITHLIARYIFSGRVDLLFSASHSTGRMYA